MAVKPKAGTCRVREQVVEDLPSGITLRFEAWEGGSRLVIAGRALRPGSRELIFDAAGDLIGVGEAVLKKLHL